MYDGMLNKIKSVLGQKITIIVIGLFFFVILLEVVLRIAGFLTLYQREFGNKVSLDKKDEYRIICLGESTTAAGGKHSWPAQLEEILNEQNIGIRFRVINKGIECTNTTFILSHLEAYLNKYNPDMVITMMGVNDAGIEYYRGIPEADTELFKNFRTYRFLRTIWMHIVNKAKKPGRYGTQKEETSPPSREKYPSTASKDFKDPNDFNYLLDAYYIKKTEYNFDKKGKQGESLEKAEDLLKRAIGADSENNELYVQLADCYILHKRYKEAEEILKKIMTKAPRDAYAFTILGWCYREQGRFAEAENILKKAIEINPQYKRAYWELAIGYRRQGKYKELERLAETIIKSDLKNDFFYGLIATFYKEVEKPREAEEYYKKVDEARLKYYNPATRYNYNKLREIVSQRIKLVCVQYPMRNIEPLKNLFDSREGVIFVDNEKIFKNALKNAKYDDYFCDNFAGDFGHCTDKGNKLLAKNIANTILKEVFKKMGAF